MMEMTAGKPSGIAATARPPIVVNIKSTDQNHVEVTERVNRDRDDEDGQSRWFDHTLSFDERAVVLTFWTSEFEALI